MAYSFAFNPVAIPKLSSSAQEMQGFNTSLQGIKTDIQGLFESHKQRVSDSNTQNVIAAMQSSSLADFKANKDVYSSKNLLDKYGTGKIDIAAVRAGETAVRDRLRTEAVNTLTRQANSIADSTGSIAQGADSLTKGLSDLGADASFTQTAAGNYLKGNQSKQTVFDEATAKNTQAILNEYRGDFSEDNISDIREDATDQFGNFVDQTRLTNEISNQDTRVQEAEDRAHKRRMQTGTLTDIQSGRMKAALDGIDRTHEAAIAKPTAEIDSYTQQLDGSLIVPTSTIDQADTQFGGVNNMIQKELKSLDPDYEFDPKYGNSARKYIKEKNPDLNRKEVDSIILGAFRQDPRIGDNGLLSWRKRGNNKAIDVVLADFAKTAPIREKLIAAQASLADTTREYRINRASAEGNMFKDIKASNSGKDVDPFSKWRTTSTQKNNVPLREAPEVASVDAASLLAEGRKNTATAIPSNTHSGFTNTPTAPALPVNQVNNPTLTGTNRGDTTIPLQNTTQVDAPTLLKQRLAEVYNKDILPGGRANPIVDTGMYLWNKAHIVPSAPKSAVLQQARLPEISTQATQQEVASFQSQLNEMASSAPDSYVYLHRLLGQLPEGSTERALVEQLLGEAN